VYYSLHHVFLRSEGTFLVVFDICRAKAASEDMADKGPEYQAFVTNLCFWLNSINSYVPTEASISAPNIILVRTLDPEPSLRESSLTLIPSCRSRRTRTVCRGRLWRRIWPR
jgi:hypothetical protein